MALSSRHGSYCMAGRKKVKGSSSYLPVPRNVLLGCCVERGYNSAAAALLLWFDCYLIHSELRGLRVRDIAFPGDPRLLVSGMAAVYIFTTKAGRKQWVQIRCQFAVAMLRKVCASRPRDSFLFGESRSVLLDLFRDAQLWLGLPSAVYVIHSLRHGGASYDFIAGVLSIDKVIIRGRWAGLPITRRYIQESQALVLALDMPPIVRRKIQWYLKSIELRLGVL